MSDAMQYNGYNASVTLDVEDKIIVGRVIGIDDIIAFHGSSVPGFEANFHSLVDHYLAGGGGSIPASDTPAAEVSELDILDVSADIPSNVSLGPLGGDAMESMILQRLELVRSDIASLRSEMVEFHTKNRERANELDAEQAVMLKLIATQARIYARHQSDIDQLELRVRRLEGRK